ncbi:MAG: ATP-binding cassette domain-containing protein, partial [Planctomycetota bacterium]
MADESDLLTLLDLNAGYGGTDCLHDLNASFHRDRCTAIVGASGSGKTTLLRCIAGLLPIRRGQIALAGHRIDPLPPHRRGVSMVFQGLSLYPHWTLRQSIIKARDVKPTKPTRTKDRDSDAFDSLDSLAEAFGIAKILDRKPHAVSGGQRRRAAVVRSLCSGRVLRLWDEPFSALDPPMAAQLAATALANHRRRGAWT